LIFKFPFFGKNSFAKKILKKEKKGGDAHASVPFV
jgi:hypothetical protein